MQQAPDSAGKTLSEAQKRTLVDGDVGCEQRLDGGLVPVLDGRVERLAAVQQLLLLRITRQLSTVPGIITASRKQATGQYVLSEHLREDCSGDGYWLEQGNDADVPHLW